VKVAHPLMLPAIAGAKKKDDRLDSGKIAVLPLVPAAQYLRMSDEAQQYSIYNQKEAIPTVRLSSHGFDFASSRILQEWRAIYRCTY
jgi:hypothetical protein